MSNTLKLSNGDIVINNSSGVPSIVSGITKLRQELQEFFTVRIQPNGWGSGLEQMIGTVGSGFNNAVAGIIDKQIRDGIYEFINIQKADSSTSRSKDELINRITYLNVSADSNNPTRYYYSVGIITEGGNDLTFILPIQ